MLPLPRSARFHTSIPSMLSGMLLMLAINGLVLALREPGTYLTELLVNWIIRREHFDVLFLPEDRVFWNQVFSNVLFVLVLFALGVTVAFWAYRQRKPGPATRASSKISL